MTLHEAMQLAGECLLAWCDPQKEYLPLGGWNVAHDTGRWWDAILRLERAIGFVIPAEIEGAMWRNLHRLTENPDGLLAIPPDLGFAKPRFELHSLREAMLAFSALARYRGSAWARERGHRLLVTVRDNLRADGAWDLQRFRYPGYAGIAIPDLRTPEVGGDLTGTTGRALEGLVEFYQAASDPLALELAERIAHYHLEHSTTADGTMPAPIVNPENIGHDHSYLGTLRGLFKYGLLTEQHIYVERVAAAYRRALPEWVITPSGLAPHDLGKLRFANRFGDPVSDPASAGDVAQLALWLARATGDLARQDDAQRIVLARLLPAQCTPRDAAAYPEANIGPRQLGGWGIQQLPHASKCCILDVVAAVAHTLCDVYTHIATRDESGLKVYLHLDYADERIAVSAQRDREATLTVRAGAREPLFIRLPRWAEAESARLMVDGREVEKRRAGDWLWIPADLLGAGSVVTLHYALPERFSEETTRSGQRFRFRWRGDEIIGIQPNDFPLPFYPTLPD